jgi:hypothetical protein
VKLKIIVIRRPIIRIFTVIFLSRDVASTRAAKGMKFKGR